MSDITNRFPSFFPLERVRTEEQQTYEEIEFDNGTTSEIQQYVPDKSPVIEVEEVSGTVDGDPYTFVAGTDYRVIDADSDGDLDTIDFSVGGKSPDVGTQFTIQYVARSVLVRYVEPYEKELHRTRDLVNEVIDSHHVDTASDSGIVDSFEDEDVVEYDVQDGTRADVAIQSDRVTDGTFGLQLTSPSTSNPVTLVSKNGLRRYPRRGDTFNYNVRLGNTDDVFSFDCCYAQTDTGEQFYRTTVDFDADTVTLELNGGSPSSQTSISSSTYTGDWITVTIELSASAVSAVIREIDGDKIGEVSISDATLDSGGIRYSASNPNTTSDVYLDDVRITKRKTLDLDRIGALFGEIGLRRGRTDSEYSKFLKSIVQSFSGRGTVDGLRFAIGAGLGVDANEVSINEKFGTNDYDVVLNQTWPSHETRTIAELAEIADPSGVGFNTIRYKLDTETTGIGDAVSKSIGTVIDETTVSGDAVQVPAATTTSDTGFADDTVADVKEQATNTFKWADPDGSDEESWDFMEWTELIEKFASTSDTLVSDDVATVGPKTTVSDGSGATDSTSIGQKEAVSETNYATDVVSNITVRSVAWGDDWETMYWAGSADGS